MIKIITIFLKKNWFKVILLIILIIFLFVLHQGIGKLSGEKELSLEEKYKHRMGY
ncbi:MAG: hypothetical protein ABIG90_02180 [bacterium]